MNAARYHVAVYILGLAYIPLVHLIVWLEESELRRRFGAAHEEYCSKVPRFFPSIRFRGTG